MLEIVVIDLVCELLPEIISNFPESFGTQWFTLGMNGFVLVVGICASHIPHDVLAVLEQFGLFFIGGGMGTGVETIYEMRHIENKGRQRGEFEWKGEGEGREEPDLVLRFGGC